MFVSCLLACCMLACQGTPSDSPSPTARLFTNVHVVDVENGQVLENQVMVVDSGRIQHIGPMVENAGAYPNPIDAGGAYAVPGLTEMHAHIPSPPTSARRIEETLFLYLSNGVTTIRGMLGHPYHLELRERQAAGELISPRIFTSSPSLNGNTVPTPEAARTLVGQYASEGYDFLKIHPGILRPVFDTLVATARENAIPFAGHVPVDVGIRHALESRYATIDHVDGFLEGLVPESANVAPAENGFFGFNFTPLANTGSMDALVALALAYNVAVVPTQSLFERWFAPTDADSLLAQPEMRYMPAETLANWKQTKEAYMSDPSWDPDQWEQFNAIRLKLIGKLQKNGFGLLLGSDAPQVFNVPGFSIHHEIDGMQHAGIPPEEILRMGTLYPARFFGIQDETGTLEAGKRAEFFLVGGNPLEDLDALKDLRGLMLGDQWFSREAIDARLEEIAQNAAGE
ncbi:amidohydrolase family protein [Robiginitalea sp. SC105]|nr:amidohydrolase family protein [Robiginitalea sp. SC105]